MIPQRKARPKESWKVSGERYRQVQFEKSAEVLAQCPPEGNPEVAMAGRSNAGKSSALNRLTGQRQLARVSKTPGRTQLMNFFTVPEAGYLVDLPGYGYAKVPDAMRRHWGVVLGEYLRTRCTLRGLVLVMDVRHPLTALDVQLLDVCAARALPVQALLTKADKISRGAGAATLQQVRRALNAYPETHAQLFSATSGLGVEEVHARLNTWFKV